MTGAWIIALAATGWAAETRPALDAACITCHRAQAAQQASTNMARALERVEDCELLRANARLTYQLGPYTYTIVRTGAASVYSVSDGRQTLSVPILYAFGLGAAGQTYVFQHEGSYYESRVSFYKEIGGLDLTMGAPRTEPRSIVEAAGRLMSRKDVFECFRCHTSNAVVRSPGQETSISFETLQPGVRCEACHGAVARHLAGVKTGDVAAARMRKLGAMSAEEMNNFCGQCHRTWEDIAANGPRGIANVRFQPYRLTNSKCYDAEDARIRCTACHDVHRHAEMDDAAYDARCQACHAPSANLTRGKKASVCKAAASKCVSCHMPRIEMPGSHHKFSDHQIRIVRKNETYPN